MSKIRIAVVQFGIKQFEPEKNLKRAENFIKHASHAKSNVIVFPEDFVTGPILKEKMFVDFEEKYKKRFVKLSKKYSIDIVTGSWIEGNSQGWFNTTYYIDSHGKIKGRYRKINLWIPEREYLTSGNEISVFNTKYGKVGLIICWDLVFPEIFRKMVKRGVKIVYCPSYWLRKDAGIGLKHDYDAEIKNVNTLCASRAIENELVLIYANAAGKFTMKNFNDELIGQSQITVPFKGSIKKLSHNKEKMFIQEIDTNILKDAERMYEIRNDLKNRVLY